MKTIGIIAEFNPFHYGHKHLITEAKRVTQADFCVVAMSGNFVQRGAPALMDKYSRSKMVLLNGADLVIELPVIYATGSAEYFARGAVRLLDKLGIVDFLCFGSECGDIGLLKSAVELLSCESPDFQICLKENLKKGMSFPQAMSQSINGKNNELLDIINQPNNILGIEYIKALDFFNAKIIPVTIKRQGSGYHDEETKEGEFASATAIRKLLKDGCSPAPDLQETEFPSIASPLSTFVPENTLHLYEKLTPPNISELLYYKLLLEFDKGYTRFFDVSNDLSDKIKKNLAKFMDYESFIHILKSKDLTYMRISRCLCHILLDIYDTDVTFYKEHDYIFYARMLGFKKSAQQLLKEIKKHSAIPLLSKMANAERLLDEAGMKMLNKDIQVSHLYNRKINEFTAPIVKI